MPLFEETVKSLIQLLNSSQAISDRLQSYLAIVQSYFTCKSLILRNDDQVQKYPEQGMDSSQVTGLLQKVSQGEAYDLKEYSLFELDARLPLELYLELSSIDQYSSEELEQLKGLSLAFFREISLQLKLSKQKKKLSLLKAENSEISRLKSQFIATVSHEIRTPMNGIIGATDLLQNTGDLSPMAKQFTEIIQESSKGLMLLVNEVLDFAKLESGQVTIVSTKQNLRQLLTEVCYENKAKLIQKGIHFNLDLDQLQIDTVYTDIIRLKQILTKLVDNAIKFTEKGSITLQIKTLERFANHVKTEVKVIDTGIGIAEEDQDKIFNSFTQADSSITRQFGGTGLGLSICSKNVALLGGEIAVESRLGTGSTFTFTFNAEEAVQERRTTVMKFEHKPQLSMKALIVDDNYINQRILAKMLSKFGIESFLVSDGAQALQALSEDSYDLIFMDILMPVMDGFEASHLIKANPEWSHVDIIVVTAAISEENMERCKEIGLKYLLTKPFTIDELQEILMKYT